MFLKFGNLLTLSHLSLYFSSSSSVVSMKHSFCEIVTKPDFSSIATIRIPPSKAEGPYILFVKAQPDERKRAKAL